MVRKLLNSIFIAWRRLFVIVVIATSVAFAKSGRQGWPAVVPAAGGGWFNTKDQFSVYINSAKGGHLYILRCQGGDNDNDDRGKFFYSGLWHCRLNSVEGGDGAPSLLLPNDATSDWDGRGRFLLNDVLGECGRKIDWGRVRVFRLRGMQLTLSIGDIRIKKSRHDFDVDGFDFSYKVQPDPRAFSSIAEASPFKEPKSFSGTSCQESVLGSDSKGISGSGSLPDRKQKVPAPWLWAASPRTPDLPPQAVPVDARGNLNNPH
ncbi:MAG: hypothetical protein ACK8QZ_04260 [Anaerolineales bacterium]